MFRRRRADDDIDEIDELDDDVDEVDGDVDDEEDERPEPLPPQPTAGPWDPADLPHDDGVDRIDLGGVRVPIPDGVELRVEVTDDVVVAAALVDGASQLIVNAFAAPKSAGIWDDVRNEIADSLRTTGGGAEHSEGTFGRELRARIPDPNAGTQNARFVGVDGPRWFLRGLLTGPAATDPSQAKRLEEVFRGIVVVRGADAMAPRDALPLHLPREAFEQVAEVDPTERVLELTERGPEITETQ